MVGGPFQLLDHDGKPFSDRDLRGSWALLYFGFTSCPDICPDELDKMTEALNMMGAPQLLLDNAGALLVMRCRYRRNPTQLAIAATSDLLPMTVTVLQRAGKNSSAAIQPVFISVDPERDSVPQVRRYIKEFHPRLIGLTGSAEQVSPTSAFRAGVNASRASPEVDLDTVTITPVWMDSAGQSGSEGIQGILY